MYGLLRDKGSFRARYLLVGIRNKSFANEELRWRFMSLLGIRLSLGIMTDEPGNTSGIKLPSLRWIIASYYVQRNFASTSFRPIYTSKSFQNRSQTHIFLNLCKNSITENKKNIWHNLIWFWLNKIVIDLWFFVHRRRGRCNHQLFQRVCLIFHPGVFKYASPPSRFNPSSSPNGNTIYILTYFTFMLNTSGSTCAVACNCYKFSQVVVQTR